MGKEKGAAAVEFAIVALLFVTMILGTIDFGHAWAVQANLSQATRDAAREMAIQDDEAMARTRFQTSFQPVGATAAQAATATVGFDRIGTPGSAGCRDIAEGTYVSPTLTGFFKESFQIRARGVMRCGG